MKYEDARRDHEYLWNTYGPANDMTGGYQDSDDLELMLKKPTKAQAAICYSNQIRYWFESGPERSALDAPEIPWDDPEVCRIADEHDVGNRP